MLNTIQALRVRALALRSSIHNEQQLSAIELAAMNAKKTNEIIDVVNELCDLINQMEAKVDLIYDEATESLNIKTGV